MSFSFVVTSQWHKSGWNSGGSRKKAWLGGRVWEGDIPPHWGRGQGPQKKNFHLKWWFLVNFDRYFCLCPRQENVEFSIWSDDLVNVDVCIILISSSKMNVVWDDRVMQAIWCLKFWNKTVNLGDNLHYLPPFQMLGDSSSHILWLTPMFAVF